MTTTRCGPGCEEGARDRDLLREGWERRTIDCEPRLTEIAEMYRSLGYEVRLEPFEPAPDAEACRTCFEADPERFRVIYTRPSST